MLGRLLGNKWFIGGAGLVLGACLSGGLCLWVKLPLAQEWWMHLMFGLSGSASLLGLGQGDRPRHKVKLTLQRLAKEHRLRLQERHGNLILKGKMSSQPIQISTSCTLEASAPELTFGVEVLPAVTKRNWGKTQRKLLQKLKRVLLHEETWVSLKPHLALPQKVRQTPNHVSLRPQRDEPSERETFTWTKQMGIALLNPAIVSALQELQTRKATLRITSHRLEVSFTGLPSRWEAHTEALFALLAPLMFVFRHPDQALLRVLRKAPTTAQRRQALEVLLMRYPRTKGWEAAVEQLWKQRSLPEPDLLSLLGPLAAHGVTHPKVKEVLQRYRQHRSAAVYTTAALLLGTKQELAFVRQKLHEGRLPEEVHAGLLRQLTEHPSQGDFSEAFVRALQHRSPLLQAAAIEQQLKQIIADKWEEWPLYSGLTHAFLQALCDAPPSLLQQLAGLFLSHPAERWQTPQAYFNLVLLPLFPLTAQLEADHIKQMLRSMTHHRPSASARSLELLLPHLPKQHQTEAFSLLGHYGDANSVAWLTQQKSKGIFRQHKLLDPIITQIKSRLQHHKEGGLSVADNCSALGQLSIKEQEGELSHAFSRPL